MIVWLNPSFVEWNGGPILTQPYGGRVHFVQTRIWPTGHFAADATYSGISYGSSKDCFTEMYAWRIGEGLY